VANVSCGFDILGFAIEGVGDEVTLTENHSRQVTIEDIVGDGGRLPREAERNTAGVAVLSFLRAAGVERGVSIRLRKNLPLGSGMGSSAASAVAALIAINELTGVRLPKEKLLVHALEAERVACGAAHADNVAPSLLGGFVLVRSYDPLDVIRIPSQAALFAVLVHPHLEVRTEDSRKILRQTISVQHSIQQSGNVAALMVGLMKPDLALIGRSLTDVIAEPSRALFIPGFASIQQAAMDAGALGCGISGSGPTLYALAASQATAHATAEAMQESFLRHGLASDVIVSPVNMAGAKWWVNPRN
jgi:homoserine kinase